MARLLSHLRFSLLAATLLFVLALNHQAVATLRVQEPAKAAGQVAPRVTVVKQTVTLEATAALGPWLAPAPDAWLPTPAPLPGRLYWLAQATPLRRGAALPNLLRARLLRAALSPHAP